MRIRLKHERLAARLAASRLSQNHWAIRFGLSRGHVLSSLGIYGVLADGVTRQTREIGIRMALGEARGAVTRRVVASAFRTVLLGAVVGVGLALAAGRGLTRFLVGVDAWNVPALIGTVAVLSIVALAAAYIPARRVSRVDPLVALRDE